MSAAGAIVRRIRREGPITFDTFVELALYGEGGFFTSGRGAGRAHGDFITSPETGSLFGACVARELDRLWGRLDRPDPFVVIEAGAGNGRLARDVMRAHPESARAMRYVLVERSEELRVLQREALALEPADEALGPYAARAGDDDAVAATNAGPVCTSLPELPAIVADGVVLANELLDNLPFGIAERRAGKWHEVRVALDEGFVELLVPLEQSEDLPDDLPDGTRLPIPRGIRAWLYDCAQLLRHGYVVLIDYVDTVPEIVRRGPDAWLRTYRAHERGRDPLVDPGTQDITADVVFEQLDKAAHSAGFSVVASMSQAEWLHGLGIDELVAEGRHAWDEGARRGDLVALAGRSRVNEAAALIDPEGLGAHRVVVLAKGTPG